MPSSKAIETAHHPEWNERGAECFRARYRDLSREALMRSLIATALASLTLALFQADAPAVGQTAPPQGALTGQITSAEEGPMEGVLVSARRAGSTITITIASDAQGRYSFPASRLEPGEDTLRIRAVGYDLDSPAAVEVQAQKPSVADLKLRKTEDLASQLSNAEWIASAPGADQQKGSLLNCIGCHTLERVMKSRHSTDDFMQVLPRMQGYVNQSIPAAPPRRRAERLMEERGDQRVQVYLGLAGYLSAINLSDGSQWSYPLKVLPRPKGKATRAIITGVHLPRETIQPHDVIVDADGNAWYSSFGEQFLGKLDPRSGKVVEFPIALNKPSFPTRTPGLRTGRDANLWLGNMYQARIVKFDRKRETFTYYGLPGEADIDAAQINMVSPRSSHVDGKLWTQNNGFAGVHRLDLPSGKIETFEPFKAAPKGEPHNIYDVIPDSKNNAYFTDFRQRHIGRIDAATGEVKLYAAPTAGSAPRRGMMEGEHRLWFGEYRGNRIGMFDTKAETFKEWLMPTAWTAPYD